MTSIAMFTITRPLIYPALNTHRMHPLGQYSPLPPSERIGFRQVQKLERVLSRSIFELLHRPLMWIQRGRITFGKEAFHKSISSKNFLLAFYFSPSLLLSISRWKFLWMYRLMHCTCIFRISRRSFLLFIILFK